MKRLIVLLLILCLILAGCGQTAPKVAAPESSVPESSSAFAEEMTVEKVRELFLQTADASCTVQDCVLIDDGAYDLVGVVQYSQGDEFTHFAFVEADGHWQTAAIMATVVENGELKYIGDGEITTKLLNEETNEILKFTLQYSNRNNGEIYFVSSSKPIF